MKTVSVIVPTYKPGEYITEAIESVLQQQLPKGHRLEIIVADDGSADHIIDTLEDRFGKSVHVYKLAHTGKPAIVRNTAIAHSSGEYIAFLDQDDIWEPGKLMTQLAVFADSKVVLSYSNATIINSRGKRSSKTVVPKNELLDGQSFGSLLKHNVISTSTVLVRRSVFDTVGQFDASDALHAIEDYELWLRIAIHFPHGIRAVEQELMRYRVHDASFSKSDNLTALHRIICAFNTLWGNPRLSPMQRKQLETAVAVTEENWSREQAIRNPDTQPLISVVMSVYNGKDHLHESIESILSQTYRDFEFIIIDDGSTDTSADIIRSFYDDRIRLISQTNHGLVYALNKGMRLARGKYIARMDADDISLADRFQKEFNWLRDHPECAIVGTFFEYIDEHTAEPTGVIITSPTKHIDIARHMYFDNPLAHGSIMAQRKVIIDVGGYSDAYGPNEDYDLWRRVVSAGRQINQLPEILYRYRLSSGGISSTKRDLQHKLFAKLVSDIWRGPVQKKSIWSIVRDAQYYKHMPSPFAEYVYKQYISHQVRLSFEFLIHGKLLLGYKNSLAALVLFPRGALRLWNTWLWAPVKLLTGRSE